ACITWLFVQVILAVERWAFGHPGIVWVDLAGEDRFVGEVDGGEVEELWLEQQAQAAWILAVADPRATDLGADQLAEPCSGACGHERDDRLAGLVAHEREIVVHERERRGAQLGELARQRQRVTELLDEATRERIDQVL